MCETKLFLYLHYLSFQTCSSIKKHIFIRGNFFCPPLYIERLLLQIKLGRMSCSTCNTGGGIHVSSKKEIGCRRPEQWRWNKCIAVRDLDTGHTRVTKLSVVEHRGWLNLHEYDIIMTSLVVSRARLSLVHICR